MGKTCVDHHRVLGPEAEVVSGEMPCRIAVRVSTVTDPRIFCSYGGSAKVESRFIVEIPIAFNLFNASNEKSMLIQPYCKTRSWGRNEDSLPRRLCPSDRLGLR